ncbi:hypothetical protein R6Q59_011769 [Mikania micrantha]
MARVPFHYPSWDRVPEHDKLGIYRTLHHYFDLQSWLGTPNWDGIRAGINEDCARRYRDRKNELKRHFDNYGGYDNVENAKNHPPDTQTQESWEKIIDELFLNADFMKRSVKNASNRSKQLYATAGGSRSYAQMRHEDERLEEEAARMRKEYGTEQIDEEECLSRVLGDRRGWNRGVGRRLRNIAPDVSYVSNSQSQLSDMQETIRLMNENMRRMQEEIDALKSKKHATSTGSEED